LRVVKKAKKGTRPSSEEKERKGRGEGAPGDEKGGKRGSPSDVFTENRSTLPVSENSPRPTRTSRRGKHEEKHFQEETELTSFKFFSYPTLGGKKGFT